MSLKKIIGGALVIGSVLLGYHMFDKEHSISYKPAIAKKVGAEQTKKIADHRIKLEQILASQSTNQIFQRHRLMLMDRDYLIPEDVMEAYAEVTGYPEFMIQIGNVPLAAYNTTNEINSSKRTNDFVEHLKNKYDRECIDYYLGILSQTNRTIFRDNAFKNDESFEKAYLHERMHKALSDLQENERSVLVDAYNSMRTHGFYGAPEKWRTILTDNWEEIYAYASTSQFFQNLIMGDNPEAYRIFRKVNNKVRGHENQTFDNC